MVGSRVEARDLSLRGPPTFHRLDPGLFDFGLSTQGRIGSFDRQMSGDLPSGQGLKES